MRFRITVDPLLAKRDIDRDEFCRSLGESLNLSLYAAQQRLKRIEEEQAKRVKKETLALILQYARDSGVKFEEILRLEDRSVFDLLPLDTTLLYVGAYGSVDPQQPHWIGRVTTSVWDYRAARRFARQITRDFSKLRFALPPTADPKFIEEFIGGSVQRAREEGKSLLSLGSSKNSTISEYLISEALGLTAFSAPPPTRPPPFMFRFSVKENELIGPDQRSAACFESTQSGMRSCVMWNGTPYAYTRPMRPQEETPPAARDTDPGHTTGMDYAVVLVHALGERHGNVVVAGISGTGTFGAAVLVCGRTRLFELPAAGTSYVRAFLVEVRLALQDDIFQPTEARVLEHWTNNTGQFVPSLDAKAYELQRVQTG